MERLFQKMILSNSLFMYVGPFDSSQSLIEPIYISGENIQPLKEFSLLKNEKGNQTGIG